MRRVELRGSLSLSILELDLCACMNTLRSFGIRYALHEGLCPSLHRAKALTLLYSRIQSLQLPPQRSKVYILSVWQCLRVRGAGPGVPKRMRATGFLLELEVAVLARERTLAAGKATGLTTWSLCFLLWLFCLSSASSAGLTLLPRFFPATVSFSNGHGGKPSLSTDLRDSTHRLVGCEASVTQEAKD